MSSIACLGISNSGSQKSCDLLLDFCFAKQFIVIYGNLREQGSLVIICYRFSSANGIILLCIKTKADSNRLQIERHHEC